MNIDRETIRRRPDDRLPAHYQTWAKLLFLHWSFTPEILRPLVPRELELDLHGGRAWVGVVPFTMRDIRRRGLPPVPGTNAFHELNVRTYVHHNGVPGVWFLSLDAANRFAVWAARRFYSLPYFHAAMSLDQAGEVISYSSRRTHAGAPPARLAATWRIGDPLQQTQPGSLEFFLTERYCLYALHRGALRRCRVWHEPWPLRAARVESLDSTMLEAAGLPAPRNEPIAHYSESLAVEIFPLRHATDAA